MKRYHFLIIILTFICLTINGCAYFRFPVTPPVGSGINITKAPIDITFDKTKIGSKRGESSSYMMLWLICFGDSGVHSAALDGNIKTVNHIDYEFMNILGLFMKYTTIVYGE